MGRSLDDARRWVQEGTVLVADALHGLDEHDLASGCALPGWTRKHLVAHLAANAEALGNLVHWAATGERRPMYSSPEQRNADIETGSRLPGPELASWFDRSARQLGAAMDELGPSQWAAEVVTAQGRTVPASETPWMRAREVMVHAVDLSAGVGFADLPPDFVSALCGDIAARRSAAADTPGAGPALVVDTTDTGERWEVHGSGESVPVTGPLAGVAAYLSGRGADAVRGPDDRPPPELPPWL